MEDSFTLNKDIRIGPRNRATWLAVRRGGSTLVSFNEDNLR